MTVEKIIVMDAEHIKVHFKYQDEFEIILQVLETALSAGNLGESVSNEESAQLEHFLLAAKEG